MRFSSSEAPSDVQAAGDAFALALSAGEVQSVADATAFRREAIAELKQGAAASLGRGERAHAVEARARLAAELELPCESRVQLSHDPCADVVHRAVAARAVVQVGVVAAAAVFDEGPKKSVPSAVFCRLAKPTFSA